VPTVPHSCDDKGTTAKGTSVDTAASRIRSDARPATARPATIAEDAVAALLAAWLVGGILSDAWAHVHRGRDLEGFFTAWHGALYAGFAATAAWTLLLAYRRRYEHPRWWRDGWPAGYRTSALGVLGFAVGGLADMAWHTRFGVELGVTAAFSPSHLLIGVAGALLVTGPLRSWWSAGAPAGARAVAAVGSLALAVMVATPLLTHSVSLVTAAATVPYDPADVQGPSRVAAVAAVDAYVLTTLLLVLPLLLVHRRRSTPGTGAALVGGVALFVLVMFGFPAPQTVAALAALAGAVAADATLAWLDAARGPDAPLRLPLAGGLYAAAVWTGHLVGLHLAEGVRWPAEMWTGTVVLTAVTGALLGALAARPATTLP
jgi:hypothetical protein